MTFSRRQAGRSADRAFQDALAKWRRQIRRRLALGVLALAAIAVVGVLLTDIDIFFIGMVSGAAMAMVVWLRDDPPPFIENWRMGRDGERWTEKELRSLQREGWHIRHDIHSSYGNIDHAAVGQGGVFLLNSKNLWGSFAIDDGGVLSCHHEIAPMSDYSLPKLERQMLGAGFGLEERLKAKLGWRVDVRPVVVLWAEFPEREAWLGESKVAVVGGRRLVEWLREQPDRLAERDRLSVAEAIAALPDAVAPEQPQAPS